MDTQEPQFDGEKVILPRCTHDARQAYADSGMLSASQDYDIGGMQLPYTVEAAANSFFAAASISIGSNMLTSGNANAIMAHGTDMQNRSSPPTNSTAAGPAPCACPSPRPVPR